MSRALKRIFHVEEQLPHFDVYPNAPHETGFSESSPLPSEADNSCVVQCPSCLTRFSLSFASMAGQSDPRFHCSQCDTIFRAEVANSAAPQYVPPLSSQRDSTEAFFDTNQPTANDGVVDTLVTHSFDEAGAPQVFTSNGAGLSPYALESRSSPNLTPEMGKRIVDRNSNDWETSPAPSKSFEIPRSVESNWSLGPPHESAAMQSDSAKQSLKLPHDHIVRSEEPSQMSLGLKTTSSPLNAQAWDRPSSGNSEKLEEPMLNTFPKQGVSSKTPKSDPRSKGEVAIKRRQLLLSAIPKIRFNIPLGRWRAPLVIAGPLLSFCLALFLVSVFLKTNPLQSEEMITSAIPGITRVAPPGLAVIEARIRKIVLDSGESIYALSGRVKNNSGKLIKRITLDGLVFDKQGMLLGEKHVLVSSPLAQSKIKSLSIDMIEDIEANASKGKTTVKDGESAPFVVTFRPQEVAGARYFSTRINSIK